MNEPAAYLLGELAHLRRYNRFLRHKVRRLEKSRNRWRDEASAWQSTARRLGATERVCRPSMIGNTQGRKTWFGVKVSTPSTDLSPTGSAEES